jgi:hypothetical protein
MRFGDRRGRQVRLRLSAGRSIRSRGTVGLRLSQRQQQLLGAAARASAGRRVRLSVTVTWIDRLGTQRARTTQTLLLRR